MVGAECRSTLSHSSTGVTALPSKVRIAAATGGCSERCDRSTGRFTPPRGNSPTRVASGRSADSSTACTGVRGRSPRHSRPLSIACAGVRVDPRLARRMLSLSVVTPVFNGARYLPHALDSVAQLSVPHEHIVIDGGSTDETVAILEARNDSQLSWVSEPDRG